MPWSPRRPSAGGWSGGGGGVGGGVGFHHSRGDRRPWRRWRIRRMSRIWKWQSLDRELIWLEKGHVIVKDEAKLRAEELTWMISLLRDKFVRSENLRRCCFVPMRRNSVLDVLRSSLFKFNQERMSVKVVVSLSRDRAKFVDVQLGVINVQMVFEGIFWDNLLVDYKLPRVLR